MKKTLLTSLIALTALFAMPVSAQSNDANTGATPQERHQRHEKGLRPENARRHGKHHKKVNAFEGITLTDAQKEAIKALRPQRPERRERTENTEGQRPDSLPARPNPEKMRADYVNAVKEILTPEQYVVFLENIVIRQAPIPGSDKGKGAMHKKGERRDRPQRPDNRPEGCAENCSETSQQQ